MRDKYRILVIGCGSIGQRHARLLSQRQDISLFIADSIQKNIDDCMSVATVDGFFPDYRDALKEKMDGVFICTPNDSHVDIAIDSLESSAYVLIEKPVSTSVNEAMKLLKYDTMDNKRILIGYMNRFNSQLQELKQIIDRNDLGNIVYTNASVYTYGTLLHAKTNFRDSQEWVLIGDYTHEIDFLVYLIGDIKEVISMSDTLGELEHTPKPNVVEVMLRFHNRAIGSIHMDYIRLPDKRTLEVIGDRGSVELFLNDGVLRFYEKDKVGFRESRTPFIRDDLFCRQIDNFIGIMNGVQKPMTTLNEGINIMNVSNAIIKSCVERRFINV